jgi:putative Mg2+ transporter-C (MgtC) family protein
MELEWEDLLKIGVAILAGGLIGAEREYRDKAAGFRTIIFITVGACTFTLVSEKFAEEGDPARIAAQIVSGIGFLGAGAILREGDRITGLTTAAMVWLSAAIGMSVGAGQYAIAGIVTTAVLIVLWLFPLVERIIERSRDAHIYQIVFRADRAKYDDLIERFEKSGLTVKSFKRMKRGEDMIVEFDTYGSREKHQEIVESMCDDPDLKEVTF